MALRSLLRKYFIMNRKNSLIGVAAAVLFSCIVVEGAEYYAVSLLMSPSLLFSFIVGKLCYMEDESSTRIFLLSLPIGRKELILEKNIASYGCIIAGLILSNFIFFAVDVIWGREIYFNLSVNLIMASFLIFYNSIYLVLNYSFDYSKTQFTSFIIMALMMVLFKFRKGVFYTVSGSGLTTVSVVLLLSVVALNGLVFKILGEKQKKRMSLKRRR